LIANAFGGQYLRKSLITNELQNAAIRKSLIVNELHTKSAHSNGRLPALLFAYLAYAERANHECKNNQNENHLIVLVETHVEGQVKSKDPRLKKASCGHERDAVTFIVAMRYWINAEA